MRPIASLLAFSVLALGALSAAYGEDWPKWRGPRGDGISQEKIEAWPADGPKKIWTANVGQGYASPIAVKGVLYIFMAKDGKETLSALDAASGTVKWSQGYEAVGIKDGGFKGTRATPTFEDGKIYSLGGGGQATCWDATDGKILWQTNVLKETESGNLMWGTASSPLVTADRVYVQSGTGKGPVAVGLDKKTGKIDWRTEATGDSGYAAPILIDVGGVKQIVILAAKEVFGVAPETGKTLWHQTWVTQYDVNATTPLYRDGNLWVSSGYGHGLMILKLSATGAEKVGEVRDLQSKFPGMILEDDHVFGNSAGKLRCLHWPDGKVIWTADVKLNEGGSVVRAGDKLLAMSERGKLYLLKADGAAVEKLAEASFFDADQVWSTPLIYNGKIYIKGGEELDCLDATGK